VGFHGQGGHPEWPGHPVIIPKAGTAVAAWYVIWAIHLPPHGSAGRWIALLLAGVFGIQNLITLYFVILSFAMDGSNQAREPVARPIRYLARTPSPSSLSTASSTHHWPYAWHQSVPSPDHPQTQQLGQHELSHRWTGRSSSSGQVNFRGLVMAFGLRRNVGP